jgi:uncharacterized protein
MQHSSEMDIGFIIEVTGERAITELTVDTTKRLEGGYYPGQPGTYVKIPVQDQSVIGIVSAVRVLAAKAGTGQEKKVAECLLIGTISAKGRFSRGVALYPNLDHRVYMVGEAELRDIFSEFMGLGFAFGSPIAAEDQRAYVHVDRFFSRHTAVVGTTGCGKSCTVASILQQAIHKYPNTHIIVLDLHGEYAQAFPDDTLLIEADKVELPYWLLDFDEFVDLTVDLSEATAKNQLSVIRNAILQARQSTDKRESLGLADAVTVDSPIFYNLEDMLGLIRGYNIQMVPTADAIGRLVPGPLYGVFDRFIIRFESKQTDPRLKFLFNPTSYMSNESLPNLLRDFLSIDTGKRMAVIDLSGIPSEALQVVVAVVSRVVFEFNLWNPDRRQFPILMVYEEAHNYVPRDGAKYNAARTAVERIAKEGRKYGVGSMVVSQRPSELSETILACCNTFVVMRLGNPVDQAFVKRLIPDSLSGMMDILPSLRTGEALIVGDSVPLPTRVLIDLPNPMPASSDAAFAECWTEGVPDLDVERIVRRWRSRQKDL